MLRLWLSKVVGDAFNLEFEDGQQLAFRSDVGRPVCMHAMFAEGKVPRERERERVRERE